MYFNHQVKFVVVFDGIFPFKWKIERESSPGLTNIDYLKSEDYVLWCEIDCALSKLGHKVSTIRFKDEKQAIYEVDRLAWILN